jgi:23S rRNA (guanine745-N1)-methyltransferase
VTEGRLAVLTARPQTLEWGIPVLFLRSPDGDVFVRPRSRRPLVAAALLAATLGTTAVPLLQRLHEPVPGAPAVPDLFRMDIGQSFASTLAGLTGVLTRIELTANGRMRLYFRFRNDTGGDVGLGFDFRRTYLADKVGNRYAVLAADGKTATGETAVDRLAPGAEAERWIEFPAPRDESRSLNNSAGDQTLGFDDAKIYLEDKDGNRYPVVRSAAGGSGGRRSGDLLQKGVRSDQWFEFPGPIDGARQFTVVLVSHNRTVLHFSPFAVSSDSGPCSLRFRQRIAANERSGEGLPSARSQIRARLPGMELTACDVLTCPVRGCGAPLALEDRRAVCARGHSFDRARSGYWNLLQPQDRRSAQPGDSKEAALARRRLSAAGHLDPLVAALGAMIDRPGRERRAVLDVGCGEGSLLAALAPGRFGEVHGTDLSAAALDLAARAWPAATWAVANADRALPYAGGAFDLLLSLTARVNPEEFRRLLAPGGILLVAVPGADDLVELREAVLGRPVLRDRLEKTVAALAPGFEPVDRAAVRYRVDLDAAGLADLLASSYRGARQSQRPRAAALAGLTVTMSRDLAVLRPS